MKYSLIILFLVIGKTSNSQNLIPDPGFEDVLMVRNGRNYDYQYLHWKNVVPPTRISGIGVPKYSVYLKYTDTINIDPHEKYLTKEIINSWYKPHSGDSYFDLQFPFFRNLNQARLNQKLQKDSTYYFQMYIKVSANNYGNNSFSQGNVGLWFTNKEFSDSAGHEIMQKNKMKIKPHIQVRNFKLSDNEKWVKFSTTFKADKDYDYVIVGNFDPLMKQVPEIYTKKQGITYKLDDLCLVPLWQKGSCTINDNEDVFELNNINFDINSFQLDKEGLRDLSELALYLKDKNIKIELKGFADSSGNEKDNKNLSQNRAKSVMTYLLENGIDSSRISFTGEGSSNPIDSNLSEEGRRLNRRVEIKIKQE